MSDNWRFRTGFGGVIILQRKQTTVFPYYYWRDAKTEDLLDYVKVHHV